MTITSEQAGGDVVEACADALLAAAAMTLVIKTADSGEPVSLDEARHLAIRAIDRIIQRSVVEGPKPR
jgi:hypothetical protein